MKITYLSHGALHIEAGDVSIVTDPWLSGPAYCNQWYPFPKPFIPDGLKNTDVILYSHGHEDHLHFPSLDLFSKNTKVFYPYSWFGSAKKIFEQAGFNSVTESVNHKRYKLSDNVSITYFANNLDNAIVLEIGDKVVLNLNDALASAPPSIANYVIDKILQKFPKVDYLLTSYGGAAFFPNCFSIPGKNDKEVAFLKETYILDNVCKLINRFNPEFVIFFASDYVLLHPQQQWMNAMKISKREAAEYFKAHNKHYAVNTNPVFFEMYPEDFIQDDKLIKISAYHSLFEQHQKQELINRVYADEISSATRKSPVVLKEIQDFLPVLTAFINKRKRGMPKEVLSKLNFSVKITDAVSPVFYNIGLNDERIVAVESSISTKSELEVAISFNTLKYAIENEWGGDAIVIGYGCKVSILNPDILSEKLDVFCIQLLCNYPSSKEYFFKNPLRSMKYIYNDDLKRKVIMNKIIKSKQLSFSNSVLDSSDIWLTRNKCEICNACNLPAINEIDNFLQKKSVK